MNAMAVIPARGGSQRIPRKNIKLFHGKPIIAYSIEVAWASKLFDQVIVSTDDEEIATVARHHQARVHIRPAELARNDVGTLAVTGDAARQFGGDFVCCIYATAPMLRAADLVRGYESLVSNNAVHCVAVGTDPLRDAGLFYWSVGMAAKSENPFYHYTTVLEPIPESRVCDINTSGDWNRAEAMYYSALKDAA